MRVLILTLMCVSMVSAAPVELLVEVESFQQLGGWVIDQQSWPVIGSSYLLAHGMGRPVDDAVTTVTFPATGTYHLWVRTRDWAPYPVGPGAFEVHVNGRAVDKVFGTGVPPQWDWHDGGRVMIENKTVQLKLHDLMGFEGRCDALYFAQGKVVAPPNDKPALDRFRREKLGVKAEPQDAGTYDLVVVGGGMAGICSAVQAARLGLQVALIQDRPVLGGNNSSEVRVHLVGRTDKNLYPLLGRIVRELQSPEQGNAHVDGARYGDAHKLRIVQAEPNLKLFLNHHVYAAETSGTRITAVTARHIASAGERRFQGRLFADCTGDGTLGFLAGADFRMGRESRIEYGESLAPEKADDFTLGTSNLWHASDQGVPSTFPACPWALSFSDDYHIDHRKADWKWETGFGNFNTITQAEEIRDHNFRAVYGNWSYLKNHKGDKYRNYALDWVAYIGGKRESRRLMGDHVLTQQDIDETRRYPDSTVTCTWTIDLHFPDKGNSEHFPGREFFSGTKHIQRPPYHIPYRCLYSRNVDNLFMAGRNISTTHVAFGSTRVMRTGGMMGEVVGLAAYVSDRHGVTPREVYENHLDALLELCKTGKP
jgi:hypothetical protein